MKHHFFKILRTTRLAVLTAFLSAAAIAQPPAPNFLSDLTIGSESADGGTIIAQGSYLGASPVLPASGFSGPTMIWLPRKAAFRVGNGLLIESRLGAFSFSSGLSSWASGSSSTACGYMAQASGQGSTALGFSSKASAQGSSAIGSYVVASGINSTALGHATTASGQTSTALGAMNYAVGTFSTVMGACTYATGYTSTAMGAETGALGDYSTTMGMGTTAGSLASTAIGRMNLGTGNPTQWVATDPLFEIGNGTPETNNPQILSNALTVYKNGNMDVQGVVTCAPGGDIPMFTGN